MVSTYPGSIKRIPAIHVTYRYTSRRDISTEVVIAAGAMSAKMKMEVQFLWALALLLMVECSGPFTSKGQNTWRR